MNPPLNRRAHSKNRSKLSQYLKRWTRPARHLLLSLILSLGSEIARRLPLTWCQRFGESVALIIRACTPRQRDKVMARINAVAPALERTPEELKIIERDHWRDLGRRFGEWLAGSRSLSLFSIDADSESLINRSYQSSKHQGLIVCTAHYGQWELMAAWLSARGFDFLAIASAPPAGPVSRWLLNHRRRLGVKVIHPQGGARRARDYLLQGGVIAALIDHSTTERSFWAPFLGQSAPHSLTVDRLARLTGSLVIWVCSYRTSEGRYRITAHELPSYSSRSYEVQSSHQTKSERGIISRHTHQLLEKLIIEAPQQWLWLHQRWTARRDHMKDTEDKEI